MVLKDDFLIIEVFSTLVILIGVQTISLVIKMPHLVQETMEVSQQTQEVLKLMGLKQI